MSLFFILLHHMKIKTKILWLLAFAFVAVASQTTFAGTGCLSGTGTTCNTPTTVNVTILPGNICIGSTGTFNFGSYTVSSLAQTVTGAFTTTGGYFYVEDLRGANSGYYTTVQMSWNLVGIGGTIASSNVSMKTTAIGAPGITLMAGTANPLVQIHAGMAAFQTLDVARQLIIRNTAANSWVIWQYGVLPQMQLVIPAYQSVGTYTGTLVYTLYTN
jgi:hypothetical protein